MRVFKDHSYLVFELDNGKTCKYDFATKKAYGFSGKEVKNISSQLRNITVEDVIASCVDNNYGAFIRAVRDSQYPSDRPANIGTILSMMPAFARFEPFFSAGVQRIECMARFPYRFEDVPIGVIRIVRKYALPLEAAFIDGYKANPDGYNMAFNLNYTTLTPRTVCELLSYKASYWDNTMLFNKVLKDYGYSTKSLLLYLDRLCTYEALEWRDAFYTLRDTLSMMSKISPKFDRYPKYLKTTHDIVWRNYNRMKETYDNEAFAQRVKPEMERKIDGYSFIYPESPQAIKDEAVQQHNCVASYIKRVIDGECDILFMRKNPEESLVTLEVRNGIVVQRKQRYNNDTTAKQDEAIAKWEAWYQRRVA